MARVGQQGSATTRSFNAAANWSFAAAILLFVSAILYIDGYAVEYQARMSSGAGRGNGYQLYTSLNTTHLQTLWLGRKQAQAPYLMAELCGAVAWVAIIAPIGCLTDLMGGSSRSANRIITSIFNAVALITLVDLTFQAGTIALVDWVATWPIMTASHDVVSAQDAAGGVNALQVLEIAWLVGESRSVWLFAMDELLLSIGFALCAFLVYTTRGLDKPLAKSWGHLSVASSIMCLLGFCFSVARKADWRAMAPAAATSTAIVYMILLPIWLVSMGLQLRARSEFVAYSSSTEENDNVTSGSKAGFGATEMGVVQSGERSGVASADGEFTPV